MARNSRTRALTFSLLALLLMSSQCTHSVSKVDSKPKAGPLLEEEPDKTGTLKYVYAIELSKERIFDGCLDFITQKFFSAKDVLQATDKENGRIICDGTINLCKDTDVDCYYGYTMTIEAKDGSYGVSFSNFSINKNGTGRKLENREIISYVRSNLTVIANDLYGFLKTNAAR